MSWKRNNIDRFGVSFVDPINRIPNSYVQSGILSGPHYSANEVSGGLPKPSYLRAVQDSADLTIKTDETHPLVLSFALGLQTAADGNEGQWKTLIRVIEPDTDGDGLLTLTGSSIIVAQLDETSAPYSITYKALTPVPKVAFDRTAPSGPSDGDLWFDLDANWMKQWDAGAAEWQTRRWIIIGEVGVGTDGYIYSMRSDFPNRQAAEGADSFYPGGGNPWRHYDGVSFLTDGQYTAQRVSEWVNDPTVLDAVTGNSLAMNAVINSSAALDFVVNSTTAMDAVASSQAALNIVAASSIAMNAVAASSIAMNAVAANQVAIDTIIKSEVAMDAIFSSPHKDILFTLEDDAGSTITLNADSINLYSAGDGGPYQAKVLIDADLTGINTLKVTWENTGSTGSQNYSIVNVDGDRLLASSGNFSTVTVSVDVSGYTGTKTIMVRNWDQESAYTVPSDLTLYDLWLE